MAIEVPSPADMFAMQAVTFEWADSYDSKDWPRLTSILAPNLNIDYSPVHGPKFSNMPAEDFVAKMSSPADLGNPCIATQHLIGASKYQLLSENSALGTHQVRAAHIRYSGPDRKSVEAKGHGHGVMHHTYTKTSDVGWKLAGLRLELYFNEYEFEKVFLR